MLWDTILAIYYILFLWDANPNLLLTWGLFDSEAQQPGRQDLQEVVTGHISGVAISEAVEAG